MKKLLMILAILFTLAIPMPAYAQDETATPADTDVPALETQDATADVTAEVVTATPQPTPIVIIITDTPPVEPPPAPENTSSGSVIVIVISMLTLVLGGGTAVAMITNFRKDAAGVAATEQLGNSVPKEVALELVKLLKGAVSGAEIAIEALDGEPAASKPPAIRSFTTEELTAELERRKLSAG